MAPRQDMRRNTVVDTARNKIDLPGSVCRRAFGTWLNLFVLVVWVWLAAVSARGQTVTATVNTAFGSPFVAAVNLATNQILVASSAYSSAGGLTVIDGATNSPAPITDPNAYSPSAVVVNPVTNMMYVANRNSNNVTVINGANDAVITDIPVGNYPNAMAVDPVTNKIYVANLDSGDVTVIDGATNETTTVTLSNEFEPVALAVNPVTNKIYVSNQSISVDRKSVV